MIAGNYNRISRFALKAGLASCGLTVLKLVAFRPLPPPLSAAPRRSASRLNGASRNSTGRRRTMAGETIPNTRIPILRSVPSLRSWRRPYMVNQRIVGLVPTMGALHKGHISLIRQAARECHEVVISIYVNPAQFGIKEDLASYPVTFDSDVAELARLDRELVDDGGNLGHISAVFAPTTADMYPSGFPGQEVDSTGSFVTITPVSNILEGASRPTFFRGVATVCMKLFNAVQPDRAYFGQKDVQQAVVIRKMERDFLLPTEIVIGPTMREQDGLALSSRNVYLGTRRRAVATVLSSALQAAEKAYASGKTATSAILGAANQVASRELQDQLALKPKERALFEVDYLALSDPETMEEVEAADPSKGAILTGAIRMLQVQDPQEGEDLGHSGGPLVRLIDNIILQPR
ncbi:hypothetical protein MKZ38_005348 [Zalerion maritima]|uniref:Pantoate--beta-alanine ligase n=1 Tax=Zalerion maritima TaxID=339359 RepID=A0AAD5WW70_9PEZI|nr:hypothetical protein MKZ38_005348 [Zalerion maritima]